MSKLNCRFCNSVLGDCFLDLGMSPFSNSYVRPEDLHKKEPFYPLAVYFCPECLLVQVEQFERPETIFIDYAYFSSYSDTWLEHSRAYAGMIAGRLGLDENSLVMEIASNDGYLLQYFKDKNIPILGVEPAANVAKAAEEKGVPTVVDFFGERLGRKLVSEGRSADLIIGNNVLAHVPDINDFVRGMKIVLKPEGVITMEFPHLLKLMEGNQFDTVYHEHFSYISFLAAKNIFNFHDLTLFDVEELPTHGGSLRIYAKHIEDKSRHETDRVSKMISKEESAGIRSRGCYYDFSENVKETKRKILETLIGIKRSGKRIAGYGAPAKGNTLLNYCGIRTDFIEYTVDRSPHKQGLFLPGTHIPIEAPEKIRETKPDFIFVLPWNIKDEIIEQMSHVREWGGKFIIPIPDVSVI
ncbi:MAG: class I SAM-dependent methyltransferase [Chloroflexi bacterium]|nr:class I SAM-dependent methyltransferase [Chloroflexota bacterium]